MNDKDKEAFEAWWKEYTSNLSHTPTEWDVHDAWQAACEYKKETLLECAHNYYSLMEELKEYKEAARSEAEEVNELQAENKKLREALEVVLGYDGDFLSTSAEVRLNTAKYAAEEALKEVEKK